MHGDTRIAKQAGPRVDRNVAKPWIASAAPAHGSVIDTRWREPDTVL
jgi:hypothetical protein